MASAGSLLLLWIAFAGLGATLLYRGWRGVAVLSEPRCAKCRYDLRGFSGTPPTVCSECGADLTKPGGVRWGEYRRSPRLIWTGVALLAVPTVVLTAGLFSAATGIRLAPPVSNAAVISNLTLNQPTEWRELERRYANRSLSDAEAAQAVDRLIADLQNTPPGSTMGRPLSWSKTFLEQVTTAGAVNGEQYTRLARAFYGPNPDVRHASRVRQGQPLRFRIEYGGPWNLPGASFVSALRAVKTEDGRDLQAVGVQDHDALRGQATPDPDQLSGSGSWRIEGEVKADLPPGEHSLTFVIDAAALNEGSAPQVVQNRPGQARHWPPGKARWSVDVPVKLTVVGQDVELIARETDPAMNPRKTVSVKSARVIRQGASRRLIVELDLKQPPVPVSFDIVLRVKGEEHAAGWHVVSDSGSSATEHAVNFPTLPAEVNAVDVVLRPNPARAQDLAGVERIWGGEIEIKDVPLRRYDLESAEGGK